MFQIVSYAQDVDFNLLHTVVLLLVVHTTISVTSIVCTASTNFYVHKDSGLTHNVTVVTLASVSMLFDVVLCKWYACRLMKFRNVIQFFIIIGSGLTLTTGVRSIVRIRDLIGVFKILDSLKIDGPQFRLN